MNIVFGMIGLALSAAVPAEARQVPAPTVTVAPLDEAAILATAINDQGQTIGAGYVNDAAHTFLWTGGNMVDITLDCPSCVQAVGYDINNAGQIVGVAMGADGLQTGLSWKNGVWNPLPTPPGYTLAIAWAVNEAGQIAGFALGGPTGQSGVLWESATSAPVLTSVAIANDINNSGVIAGVLMDQTTCMAAIAVTEHAGVVTNVAPDCLKYSQATSISDSGAVAVTYLEGSIQLGAMFKDGQRIPLPPVGGFGQSYPVRAGFNSASDLIGFSTAADPLEICRQQGTAWLREGNLLLPSLEADEHGCHQAMPYRMNIHGQVAGHSNGRAVIWHIDIDRFAPTVTVTTSPVKPSKGGAPTLFSGRVVDGKHGPSSASGVAAASYRLIDEYGLIQPSGTLTLSAAGEFSMVLPLDQVKGGDHDGRKYTLEITTSDRAGNSATSRTDLIVKHGNSK